MHNNDLPKRLKHDAIAEALLEIRFSSEDLPEVVVGKLASNLGWAGFQAVRLPTADIPASIREQDPNLSISPLMELQNIPEGRIVKLGPSVLSLHILSPYPGWDAFRKEIDAAVAYLFTGVKRATLKRIGFKYINILEAEKHGIRSVSDLNIEAQIAHRSLEPPLNLNYIRALGEAHKVLVRVASPEFIAGPPGIPVSALVDVDIFTPEIQLTSEAGFVSRWVDEAHDFLKAEFFALLPKEKLAALTEG